MVAGSHRQQQQASRPVTKTGDMVQYELNPILMEGKVVSVNDTAVKVDVRGRLGVITVPKRWVLTDFPLQPGLRVEFYFSYMQVTGPAEGT